MASGKVSKGEEKKQTLICEYISSIIDVHSNRTCWEADIFSFSETYGPQFKSNVQAAQITEWMGKAFLDLKISIQFLENYHPRLN